ncbi:MAG: MarR family transcriptional regulator, partial [Novosphingobium sp.]|nr:MarR family transcriptional regulator [Novosphingobium sp.]
MGGAQIADLRQANRGRKRQDALAREFGLTGARLAVLVEVGRNSGEGTATGIAEHLGTSRQAVQRILNVIASLGYV